MGFKIRENRAKLAGKSFVSRKTEKNTKLPFSKKMLHVLARACHTAQCACIALLGDKVLHCAGKAARTRNKLLLFATIAKTKSLPRDVYFMVYCISVFLPDQIMQLARVCT